MKRLLAGRGTTIAVMGMLLALVAGGSYALAASGGNSITVCVKKNGGGLYKARNCHRRDSKLSWNKQGPAGKAGKNGANGLNGTPGAAGAAGAAGKDGFVQIGSWESGVQDTITANSADFVFAGPTTSLTTSASQAIAASGSAALAATAGTDRADVSICKQASTGGAVTPLAADDGTFEVVDVLTTRESFGISEAGAPGAGTWSIGMCVKNTGPNDINDNDWSIGYAFVTNSTLSVSDPDATAPKGLKSQHTH